MNEGEYNVPYQSYFFSPGNVAEGAVNFDPMKTKGGYATSPRMRYHASCHHLEIGSGKIMFGQYRIHVARFQWWEGREH